MGAMVRLGIFRVHACQSTSLVLLSDQMALQRSVDIVANNVANSSTTGFKREGIEFETYDEQPTIRAARRFRYQQSHLSRHAARARLSRPAIRLILPFRAGYFRCRRRQGTQYTRNGALHTDNQGQISDLKRHARS